MITETEHKCTVGAHVSSESMFNVK